MFVYGIVVLDRMQSFQEKAFLPFVQVPFHNFDVVANKKETTQINNSVIVIIV